MDNNSTNFHNIMESTEHDLQIKKSMVLFKQKTRKMDDFIKKHCENIKETERLTLALDVAKKEAKHNISNYVSAMDKIRKLELKSVEDKERNKKLTDIITKYETNINADEKNIEQLNFKIKVLEDEHSAKIMEYALEKSFFEDKIKGLEDELRKLKSVPKPRKREKKNTSENFDIAKLSIDAKSSSDIGINVSLCNESNTKCEVQDKSIMTDKFYNMEDKSIMTNEFYNMKDKNTMTDKFYNMKDKNIMTDKLNNTKDKNVMTDEFYNMKNDPHPLFCAKCEAHLSSDETPEKIYKTMSTYPELIEDNLSPPPKRSYSPPRLLSSTHLEISDSTNRNKGVLPKISEIASHQPHNHLYNNDVMVDNPKLGRSSAMTQICENGELRNVHARIINRPSSILSTHTLSQDRNCGRENFCSDDLLTKHSSSIKEMEKKIRILESKVKKRFQRLNNKVDINSRCCCSKNNSLNLDVLSIICKSLGKYSNEEREMSSTNERNINSEKCMCHAKRTELKTRQSRCDAYGNTFSRKIEDLGDRCQVQVYNKTDSATKAIHSLRSEATLSAHDNNSFLETNVFNTSPKYNDESDNREFVSYERNTSHSTDVACAKNNVTMSRLSADKINASENHLVRKDNIKALDMDNQIEIGTILLSDEENSTDHVDGKTADVNAGKNKIKRKDQDRDKVDETYASNNLSSKDIETTDVDDRTEIGMISLPNDEISANYNKIIDINAEKSKVKRKDQDMHKDNVDEIYSSDDLSSKNNVEAINMDNRTEIGTIFLSNENSTEHAVGKTVNINIEESKIKRKCQNVHKDKVDEICTSDNFSIKDNVEAIDIDNQTKTRTSNDKNSTGHADGKINDINLEENKIKRKGQNTPNKDKIGNRLLKKIRNLKRKTQVISRANKQENIELSSDYISECSELAKKPRIENEEGTDDHSKNIGNVKRNLNMQTNSTNKQENNKLHSIEHNYANLYEPPKKLRIAHTPKMSVLQSSNESNSHCTIRSLSTLAIRRKDNGSLKPLIGACRKDNLLIESEESRTINEKCDEKIVVEFFENDISHCDVEKSESYNNINEATEVIRLPSPRDKGIIFENCITDSNMEEPLNKIKNARNTQQSICGNETIEVQAVETRNKNACVSQRDKEREFLDTSHSDDKESQKPMSRLTKFIKKKRVKKYNLLLKKVKYIRILTDRFVKKQLQRLINSAWEDSIHEDVVEKLRTTCGPRVLAKCIVQFLMEETNHNEVLDKSFTPPAPLLTTFEQKIITLLVDLEVSKPTVIYFVQTAIEYNLFKLNSNIKTQVVSLTRIYVGLSRIQKDREKVRMMCCNALYCMTGFKSIHVLHAVLTCWSEVLPNAEAMPNKELLPKCIAFLIESQLIENRPNPYQKQSLQKLNILKNLLSRFYNYCSQRTASDVANELMTALKAKRIDGLDTAIILIAKKEGPSWTYENIILSGLLPMIIRNEYPCIYSAFSLLGRLLRAFPLEDEDNIVQEISEQFRDLIQSGQVSHDQQEGIISALLSLSRHKFDIVASSVMEWTPSKSLRPIVDMQLQAFINGHSVTFWKNYLKKKPKQNA